MLPLTSFFLRFFARLTPELRLARQPRSQQGRISHFVSVGRRLSAIVRRRPNGGGPQVTFNFIFSSFLRPADAGATAGTPAQKPARPNIAFVPSGEGCPP